MALSPTIPNFRSECPPSIWAGGGLQHVFLELTPACNNRCPGCLNESFIADFHSRALKEHFHRPALNKNDWLTVLSRLPKTLKLITLSGGEPTLHPEFLSILLELENRGLEFTIFTNGRWPNTTSLVTWLQSSHHFKGFLISLHGASATTHETFSGLTGSFNETIRNIRTATNAQLPVTLSTVVTHQNLQELALMPSLAMELGAEELSFNRYLYTPERIEALGEIISPPSPNQLQNAIRQIETLRQEYAGQIRIGYGPTIPQCFESSASQGCSAGEASLVIDPWGNVKPCLHVDLICGNIVKQDFDTIWNVQELITWRGLSDESCSNCSAFSTCGGGCRAMSLSWGISQDPLMKSHIQSNFIKLSEIVK